MKINKVIKEARKRIKERRKRIKEGRKVRFEITDNDIDGLKVLLGLAGAFLGVVNHSINDKNKEDKTFNDNNDNNDISKHTEYEIVKDEIRV